jgi:transcriptional regulator of arginine metabolism
MSTAAARRRLVRRFVTSREVTSQADIVGYLSTEGHDVTQATVSRDLQIIGATKADGDRYVLRDGPDPEEALRHLARSIDEFVESITASGPLVVLRTPPGAAQVVAAAIDNAGVSGVLGTVAGDDTIMIVASEEITGSGVASNLEQIGQTA